VSTAGIQGIIKVTRADIDFAIERRELAKLLSASCSKHAAPQRRFRLVWKMRMPGHATISLHEQLCSMTDETSPAHSLRKWRLVVCRGFSLAGQIQTLREIRRSVPVEKLCVIFHSRST
jgi:hypothetical protein